MRLPHISTDGRTASVLRAAALLLAAAAGSATAQQPSGANQSAQEPVATASTISVDARLVNIPVVVYDKKGVLVQNLTKDNFTLQVDGHAQTIRYFNVDRDLPLTLGLLVDTSMSQREVLDEERTASISFIDDMLNGPADRDKAFVVQFAAQTDLLQDVTGSKPKLQAALKQIDSPSFSGGNSGGSRNDTDPDVSSVGPVGGGPGKGRRGGGTTLYDALFLSSDELMGKQKGRKAVIILSDGVDSGSKESLATSIEAAQRADTIIYAIYFKGKEMGQNNQNQSQRQGGGFPGGRGGMGGGYPGGGGGYPGGRGGGQGRPQGGQENRVDGKKILERMAGETGGRLFEISKKQTVAEIYKQIGEELRAQYRLGYSPDAATASDGYHQIDLALAKGMPKEDTIQTRDGYYIGK